MQFNVKLNVGKSRNTKSHFLNKKLNHLVFLEKSHWEILAASGHRHRPSALERGECKGEPGVPSGELGILFGKLGVLVGDRGLWVGALNGRFGSLLANGVLFWRK